MSHPILERAGGGGCAPGLRDRASRAWPQLPLTPQDVTSPEEQRPKAPAAPPKPWSTFKAMTLGSLPSAHRDRLELCRADWDSPCAGLDGADGDFQTEV